ncbi:ABC transporter substrate-binding protein [Microbacterium sp. KR10-403]|uniref:ABC transporter substrate-binding protein n=1 Tax=Microbacterium sp. KR10-403 TaxID=3158581 RepID=UPI0032E4A1D3
MKMRTLLAPIALVGALVLAGCSGGGTSSAPSDSASTQAVKGGTVYVLNSGYSHLDPAQGYDTGVMDFYRLIYRTLTTQGTGDQANEILPDLATDLGTPNDDATVWTFHLKDDIFFEDGTPITSEDVRFGVERSFDPDIAVGSPYARTLLADVDGYEGVYRDGHLKSIETPDDKTIIFHLSRSFPDFAHAVSQPVYTPFPADAGVTTTSLDEKPIASGPYRVAEYTPGTTLKLARNDYWKASSDGIRPALPDAFEWNMTLDAATMDERLIASQGDDANAIGSSIQAASIARVQTPEIKSRTLSGTMGCSTFLALNTTKKPFDDEKARQAVAWAVDKSSVQNGTGGTLLADVATTILPPQMDGRQDFDVYPSTDHAGDPEKAKALLTEAGLPDGFTMTLDLASGTVSQAQGAAIQQSLEKAGITVKLNSIDSSSYWESVGNAAKENEAVLGAWCSDWGNGETFLPPLFEGSQINDVGNYNWSQLNDKSINEKMTEIRSMTDIEAAGKAWSDIDKSLVTMAAAVPLVYQKVVLVTGSNIAGAYSDPAFSGQIDLVAVGLKNADE